MNAYDKGNELARALKESDEFKALGKARRELDTDSSARDMVKDFLRKQMEMQLEAMSGKSDVKAKQESLQKMGELLALNPRARDYIAAYFRFQQVMQDVYKMIGDAVGEGLDPFAEK
jgi:cell fate (sporulation/competence/biofilm development) regulator YlbF (YheA/YmcA/DUF963 family)